MTRLDRTLMGKEFRITKIGKLPAAFSKELFKVNGIDWALDKKKRRLQVVKFTARLDDYPFGQWWVSTDNIEVIN